MERGNTHSNSHMHAQLMMHDAEVSATMTNIMMSFLSGTTCPIPRDIDPALVGLLVA